MNSFWAGFDLHSHSTCSDGRLSPTELVQLAAEQGVHTLALTDHDTVRGIPEAMTAAEQAGIQLIPGVEISTLWSKCNIHVVGLNLDIGNDCLLTGLEQQARARYQRARMIAQKLASLGIDDLFDKAEQKAAGGEIGRPHFAQVLLDEQVVGSMQEAFKKYLGAGKKGDVKSGWPDIEAAVRWIHAAGGQAVLAHPLHYKLTNMKRRALLRYFVESGGDAMEVVSGSQTRDQTHYMAQLADEFGLKASSGSDFHFITQWQLPGRFSALPENVIPVWCDWQASKEC